MADAHSSTPQQVASEVRRLAGAICGKTPERPWAEIIDALKHCARRIDDLASAMI